MTNQADFPDLAELTRLAEELIELNKASQWDWAATVEDARFGKTHTEFALAASPAAILALIATNQVLRNSAERYWWLRENAQQDVDGWRNEVPVLVHALSHVTGWRNRIDESVDAAMTAGERS